MIRPHELPTPLVWTEYSTGGWAKTFELVVYCRIGAAACKRLDSTIVEVLRYAGFRDKVAYPTHQIERSPMPIDAAFVGALHVEYLKKRNLADGERPHHTLI